MTETRSPRNLETWDALAYEYHLAKEKFYKTPGSMSDPRVQEAFVEMTLAANKLHDYLGSTY
jgi:hypothetical protein